MTVTRVTVGQISRELLREANQEPWIRGRVRRDARREPIVYKGRVVGFCTPHRAADGTLRLGPIYVEPTYRGRGLAAAIYRSIRESLVACVDERNVESVRLHERCGFVRWRRYACGWYWRRPQLGRSSGDLDA